MAETMNPDFPASIRFAHQEMVNQQYVRLLDLERNPPMTASQVTAQWQALIHKVTILEQRVTTLEGHGSHDHRS